MERSEASRAWEHPPSLGPYQLREVLGQGGMGVVYAGVHRETGEAVAVKTVRVRHESQLGSIRREIVALSRLRHPGVVRVLGTGLDGSVPWYAMERLEGATLADLHSQGYFSTTTGETTPRAGRPARHHPTEALTEGQPSWGPATIEPIAARPGARQAGVAAGGRLGEALTLVARLCRTLAYVHGEGMIHRDLKPSNLFVRPGLRPVLVDFGLVRRLGREGREVLDVGLAEAGTAGYMAPEQFRGEPGDARVDLYAVGCLLYEMLTGQLPFGGASLVELRSAHLALTPVRPGELVTGVPPELDALVMRLLEKQPRRRVGHAADVEEALVALGAEPDPSQGAPAARPYVYRPTLAGRDQVLAQLTRQLDRASRGEGALVLLEGESGIGKTYLATVFARRAQVRGFQVVADSCLPAFGPDSHEAAPLHPFRRLLQTVADRCLGLGPEATAARLGAAARLLGPYEPSLGGLPGVADLPEPPELAAQAARARLIEAMVGVIATVLEDGPLLLILDDIQWLDELSAQVLLALDRELLRGRLLVLCSHRHDAASAELAALRSHPAARALHLDPLDEATVQELVADMLAVEEPPDSLVHFLARRCRGNPFFVAEYLRAAVAEGQLVRRDGHWQVPEGAVDIPLPDTLGALVQRRLGGLGAEARAMAEAAAVLGDALTWTRLEQLAALPPGGASAALRELRRAQVFDDSNDDESLRFAHDKLRQVADESLPPARRAELHRRAARLLEGQPGIDPRQLAAHFAAGHEPLPAIVYLEQAGAIALRTFSNRDALECFLQARTLDEAASAQRPASWDQALAADFVGRERLAPEPGAPPAPGSAVRRAAALRRARWWRAQSDAHFALGDLDACSDDCRAALVLLGFGPPDSPAGWLLDLARQTATRAGRGAPGRLGALLGRLGAPPVHAAAGGGRLEQALFAEAALLMQRLSERFYFHLDAVPMVATSLAAVNLAEHTADDVRVAMPYGMLGTTLTLSKLRGTGRRYLDQGAAVAHRSGDHDGLAFCLLSEAAICAGDARWGQVGAHCDEALRILTPRGDHHRMAFFQTMQGHVEFYTGRFGPSRDRFLAIASRSRALGHQQMVAWGLYAAARAALPLGHTDEAHALLDEARRLLDPLADDPSKIICTGLLALSLERLGRHGEADSAADAAAERIGRNLPTVFSTVDGYASVAEVRLERWRRSGLDVHRAPALRAVRSLLLFSVNLALGWPHYHRLLGRSLWQLGHRRLARESWHRSARRAQASGMPYPEALARRDLALSSPHGSAERARHLDDAARLFDQVRCPLDLDAAPLDR